MSWFSKLFAPKRLTPSDQRFFDACHAFATGERIWREAVGIKGEGWRERRLPKLEEALKCLDEAIKNGLEGRDESESFSGFDESEAYALRAYCLDELGFYFEAVEDYNKAIAKKPRKAIAHLHHCRSLVKKELWDIDGYLADFNEAIRLSKLDNEDNAYWNKYAQSTGFASQTGFYEMCYPTEDEIYVLRRCTAKEISEALAKVKRRTARGVPDKPQA